MEVQTKIFSSKSAKAQDLAMTLVYPSPKMFFVNVDQTFGGFNKSLQLQNLQMKVSSHIILKQNLQFIKTYYYSTRYENEP